MTKENSKSTLKILALFLILLALLSMLFTPLLSGFQANASSYTLTDSLVQNESGSWVSSGGKWLNRWLNYNCYAFAVERFEYPKKYTSRFQYQPGNFSHNTELNIYRKSAEYIANAVKDDLVAIGHEESSISISTAIPTVNSNQQLICIRTSSANANDWDYHFMRFDSKTDAWYHKPGGSAVLKYKYIPSNTRNWILEYSDKGIEKFDNRITYTSTIYFIRYEKIQLDTTTGISSISKNIPAGKDTMVKMYCQTALNGHLVISGNGKSVKATIYDSEMNNVATYTGLNITADFSFEQGTYYVQLQFTGSGDSGTITATTYNHRVHYCTYCNQYVGPHTYDDSFTWKNDRQHLARCSCGVTQMKGHAVRDGSFVGGYATCILCGGRASVGFVQYPPESSTLYRTANGSYILPNGVIVLVEEDIEAFFQGTLVFTKDALQTSAA